MFCSTGATLQSWENSVLGFENAVNYLNKENPYFGATIGPVANRLYQPKGIVLHGGEEGWAWKEWKKIEDDGHVTKFELSDSETAITAHVTYTMTKPNENSTQLEIEYTAESKNKNSLPISMTNHSYFCLDQDGEGHVTVDDHNLWLCNDHVIEHKDGLQSQAPTGELVVCGELPAESRDTTESHDSSKTRHPSGSRDTSQNTSRSRAPTFPLKGIALDHTFAVSNERLSRDPKLDTRDDALATVAVLSRDKTRLTVKTTEPCFQVYTGDYNNVSQLSGESRDFGPRSGVAIECSRPTNAWNVPRWKNWVDLAQGQYGAKIVYLSERLD